MCSSKAKSKKTRKIFAGNCKKLRIIACFAQHIKFIPFHQKQYEKNIRKAFAQNCKLSKHLQENF